MLEEFCQAPLCLELDLDTYEGDWHHVARFRGRSGWLVAARATLESETDIYRTVIAAGCDEWDNPIPSFQAAHLLECIWTRVHPCFDEPPAVLEELMCEEEGQVYSRWQRETNTSLQQHLIESEAGIAAVEREARLASDCRLKQIADLRRRRRTPGLTDGARSIFDSIIADLEAEDDRSFDASRAQVAALRRRAEEVEEKLWSREDVLLEISARCYAFWSAPATRLMERDPWIKRGSVGFNASFSQPSVSRYHEAQETPGTIDAHLRRIETRLKELMELEQAVQNHQPGPDLPSVHAQFGHINRREALASCRHHIRELRAQRAHWKKLRKEVE